MMALGIGLAVNNGRAAIEGLFGRDVEFVRTPKRGTNAGKLLAEYRGKWPWHNAIELVFALYCSATLLIAIATKSWASVPFVALFSTGFLYVGLTSLIELLRPKRGAQGDDEETAQAPSTHSSPRPQSMLS